MQENPIQIHLFRFSVIWMLICTFAIGIFISFQMKNHGINIQSAFYVEITFGIWAVIFIVRRGINLSAIFGKFRLYSGQWLWVFLSIPFLILNFLVLVSLVYIIFLQFPDVLNYLQDDIDSDMPWRQELFLGCFLAPIVEELVFRGLVLQNLMQRTSITRAILLSSFAFSVIHFHPFIIIQFCFGIFVSIIYIKTQSLFLPIAVHILVNSITKLAIYIDASVSTTNETAEFSKYLTVAGPWILVITAFGLVTFGYYLRSNWPCRDVFLPYQTNLNNSIQS